MTASASAQDTGGNDLRDIRVGMAITDLPIAGYANFACANDAQHKLTGWSGWRDCPADATGRHAVQFGYSAETDREGTIVAGHPVVLTLLIDNAGTIDGLQIDTDPKAQLYLRKKAFLFATQIKSRYGRRDGRAPRNSLKLASSRWAGCTSGNAAPRPPGSEPSSSNAACFGGPTKTRRTSSMKHE